MPTNLSAPNHALLDDKIIKDFAAISNAMLDGLVFVSAVSDSEKHDTSAIAEELPAPSVLDTYAECESFSPDYGDYEGYEYNNEDEVSASDLIRARTMLRKELDQAATHIHSLIVKEDMRMIKKFTDMAKEFNAYRSLSGSPLKQCQGKDQPVEAGHASVDEAIVDVPVPHRKGKKERCVSKWQKFQTYKETHTISGRKKPSAPDSELYTKRYKTSRRDRVAQQSV